MSIVTADGPKRCYRPRQLCLGGLTTPPARENFRKNLPLRMKKQSLNDSKLAELVGVSVATIGRWQSGEREPSFENLEKIAVALGISVSLLVAGPEDVAEMEADYALRVLEAAL